MHDIRFVVADKIEDTYEELRKQWWGTQDSLHLDAWAEINNVDGYDVSLKTHQDNGDDKLFFINLGGYDSKQFTELHKNILIVATNPVEAKAKALERVKDWESPHRDYQYEAEHCLYVSDLITPFINLKSTNKSSNFKFTCKYVPIGIKH